MQIVIDCCCATFAEVQKRGEDFWAEFELYVADLLVGLVVNVALVGMFVLAGHHLYLRVSLDECSMLMELFLAGY
jgi:hypothetical protein